MKTMKIRKVIIVIALILLCIVGYLFYSRPMSIQQRYPMLNLDKCTEITGYYKVDEQIELTEFSIEKDSKEFEALWDLLYEQDYRRIYDWIEILGLPQEVVLQLIGFMNWKNGMISLMKKQESFIQRTEIFYYNCKR